MVNNTCLTQDLSAGTARARGLSRSVHLLFLIDKENSTILCRRLLSRPLVPCAIVQCAAAAGAMAARSDCSSSSARSSSAGDHRIHKSSFVAGMWQTHRHYLSFARFTAYFLHSSCWWAWYFFKELRPWRHYTSHNTAEKGVGSQ